MIDTQTDYRARSVDESQRISVGMRCREYCVFPVPLSAVGWCHCGPTGPVTVSHAWPPSRLLTEAELLLQEFVGTDGSLQQEPAHRSAHGWV